MNEQKMAHYGERLRDTRDAILSQIAFQRDGIGGRVDAAAAHFSHPQDSHAQLMSEKDIEFALNEQDSAALSAVEAAQSRITSGTYGLCIDCGEQIVPARLKVSPEAARCVSCQVSFERQLAAV